MSTIHQSEILTRYVVGAVSDAERYLVETHLEECEECRAFVDFVHVFKAGLRRHLDSDECDPGPCPDAMDLVSLVHGELEADSAERVRMHLARCTPCLEAYVALLRANDHNATEDPPTLPDESVIASVEERNEPSAGVAQSGAGPVIAMVSLQLTRVPMGDNRLWVSHRISQKGTLTCRVARSQFHPSQTQIRLSIWSPGGQRLHSGTLIDQETTLEVVLDDPHGVHTLRLEAGTTVLDVQLTPPSTMPTPQPV